MSESRGVTNPSREARHYELRIQGHLESRWAGWFEGMSLRHLDDGTTVIYGPVTDQAALHGLLQRVRDLGLPLVSVVRTADDEPQSSQPQHGEA
jgi:hypothetical protein